MTDAQWYTMLNQKYDAKAAALTADGWAVQNEGKRFIEHFEKDGQLVQIVRQLGASEWYTTEYHPAILPVDNFRKP